MTIGADKVSQTNQVTLCYFDVEPIVRTLRGLPVGVAHSHPPLLWVYFVGRHVHEV